MNSPDDMPSAPARRPVLQQRDHRVELGRGRRAVRHAHHHQAERVVADQHAGVDGGRREAVEIIGKGQLAERRPRRRRRQIVLQQFDLAGQRRRDREAAMADDLGGDALADLALGLGIDRQREVGMGLDVDEARRDGEARRRRWSSRRRSSSARADRGDAAVCDGEIARRRRRAPLPSNRSPPRIRMSCTGLPRKGETERSRQARKFNRARNLRARHLGAPGRGLASAFADRCAGRLCCCGMRGLVIRKPTS